LLQSTGELERLNDLKYGYFRKNNNNLYNKSRNEHCCCQEYVWRDVAIPCYVFVLYHNQYSNRRRGCTEAKAPILFFFYFFFFYWNRETVRTTGTIFFKRGFTFLSNDIALLPSINELNYYMMVDTLSRKKPAYEIGTSFTDIYVANTHKFLTQLKQFLFHNSQDNVTQNCICF